MLLGASIIDVANKHVYSAPIDELIFPAALR